MKVITTGLLNRFWTKGIKPWLDKRIKSYADLMVTTASGYTPDALAVKEGFAELNSKLKNAHTGKINAWNTVVTVTSYTYTSNNSGVYVTFSFKLSVGVTNDTQIPLITVDQQIGETFAPTYGQLVNADAIIFPHENYSYAFMIRASDDLVVNKEYYAQMYLPFI